MPGSEVLSHRCQKRVPPLITDLSRYIPQQRGLVRACATCGLRNRCDPIRTTANCNQNCNQGGVPEALS